MRIVAASCALAVAAACASQPGDDRPVVVAAFYPLAELAERVGGDAVAVVDLTPPGGEPHDLEPAPDDLVTIADAALVLYVGGGFQPALEDALAGRAGPSVDLGEGEADPHVWLDPTRMVSMAASVALELGEALPEHAEEFVANASAYAADLTALGQRYLSGLADCELRTIVVTHGSFGHLATPFGLTQRSITGTAPTAEPDAAALAALAETVDREGVDVIFTEPLIDPAAARTLARETGARTAVLDPIESITPAARAAGDDYLAVMDRNLEALREALRCA